MSLDEIRKALCFSWSVRDENVRLVRFRGEFVACYAFNEGGAIFVSLYDWSGERICNVYFRFVEDVLRLVVAHVDTLLRMRGISHKEHCRILRGVMG